MKLNCNVIRDLLPLYADQICSDESRELVKEHLAECGDCSALLGQMHSMEIETRLRAETGDVLRRQASFFKRKSTAIGAVIASIFMIPVLVCLIVNLATGAALDWFFIVLASLVTAASLIVIPLVMPENKLLWTLGTFTESFAFIRRVGGFSLRRHRFCWDFPCVFCPLRSIPSPSKDCLAIRKD